MEREESIGQDKETSNYICYRTPSPITIDGDLTKRVWQDIHNSGRFVDMISGAPGLFATQAAALWDDEAL